MYETAKQIREIIAFMGRACPAAGGRWMGRGGGSKGLGHRLGGLALDQERLERCGGPGTSPGGVGGWIKAGLSVPFRSRREAINKRAEGFHESPDPREANSTQAGVPLGNAFTQE